MADDETKAEATALPHAEADETAPGDRRTERTKPLWGRSFVAVNNEVVESQKENPHVLCVASFNILAQSRAQLSQFPYCQSFVLTWTLRRQQILDEILTTDADILLLQDVDNYAEWWQPQLRDKGYDAWFEKQTGRSRVGVAVMFKRELFNLFRSDTIILDRLCADLPPGESTRAKQGNVGVMALLQPWEQCVHPTAVLAVSIQLTAGIGFRELRRWQMKYAFQRIQKFNQDFNVPVLLGITSEDEPSTPLYHMIATGFMPQLPRKPRRPERPMAHVLSMASARVEWKPPFDPGDGEIIGYRVEKRAGGNKVVGFVVCCTVPADQTFAIITGLSSGLTYEFQVAGVNKHGVGLYSTPSIPINMPVPRGRTAVNFIELRRLSNHTIDTHFTEATHISVPDSTSGLSPRFDGGGTHYDAPPTRPGPVQGPVCDEHCRSHHNKRIHWLELNSAYATYCNLAPKTAAEMKAFKAELALDADTTEETKKYSVSLKRNDPKRTDRALGLEELSLSSDSDDDEAEAGAEAGAGASRGVKGEAGPGEELGAGDSARPSTSASVTFEGKEEGDTVDETEAMLTAAAIAERTKPGTPSDHTSKELGSWEPPVVRPTRSVKVPCTDTFLMYSRGAFKLQSVLSLLSPAELKELDTATHLPYLPSRHISSDHQMLAARFVLEKNVISSGWA